eukprot:1408761-Alexandrium_andersonii.AAC.1
MSTFPSRRLPLTSVSEGRDHELGVRASASRTILAHVRVPAVLVKPLAAGMAPTGEELAFPGRDRRDELGSEPHLGSLHELL